MRLQISNGFPGNGFFERLQESGDLLGMLTRIDQQMHVLGHQDVGPNLHAKLGAGSFQCFTQTMALFVRSQESETADSTKTSTPLAGQAHGNGAAVFPHNGGRCWGRRFSWVGMVTDAST